MNKCYQTNIKDNKYIKHLFEIYNIRESIGLNGKYYDAFINRIVYEYRVFDSLSFSTSKFSNISQFYLKYVIIICGAIISWLKSLKYKKHKVLSTNIIGLPFADHIIRYKKIQNLSDIDIDIVYPPIFHIKNYVKHFNSFKKDNKSIILGTFTLKSIINATLLVIKNWKRYKCCSKELDTYFGSYTCKLPGIIIFSVLYREFIKRFIDNNLSANKIIWLFDYDFDLKYIIFNEEIHKRRSNDITIHLQHGSFFSYNEAYCNPVSDISLCCSNREKNIIDNYNKYNSNIISFGAPLQTFIDESSIKENWINTEYDILILLTDTYSKDIEEKQIELLHRLNRLDFKCLLRFRPASQLVDKKNLEAYIGKSEISVNKTLIEDISRSKIIISFSEDALYTAIRNNKKIILITREDPINIFNLNYKTNNMKIVSSEKEISYNTLSEMINNFNAVSYNNDSFVIYNFGINDMPTLKNAFTTLISSFF